MDYREIDLETFSRKDHFLYFSSMQNPYAGFTVEVDITDFTEARKNAGLPFFLSFLYCVVRAANSVPELRQRIVGGRPVEFERCDPSTTVMRENGTYGYCRINCCLPFEEYLPQASELLEEAKHSEGLVEDDDILSCLFVSSIPWIHYTDVFQPTPTPPDSNPRICWGKYLQTSDRVTIPVTILVNHALADGLHMGRFYEALERELKLFIDIAVPQKNL